MQQRAARHRFPLMALAGVSLLAALWAGLVRIGWQWPGAGLLPAGQHGAFMISGFLGTLIGLERAVALRQNQEGARAGTARPGYDTRLYYLAPALAGAGSLALLVGLPPAIGRAAITLGAAGLTLLFVVIYRLQANAANATMAAGAVAWLAGNVLWLADVHVSRAVPWWAGFLILTIVGERLELARVMFWGEKARRFFLAAIAVFGGGLLLALFAATFGAGMRLSGAGMVLLAAWLVRYDIARRTVRRSGLTRYIAACLLPGYFWLGAGGLLWLWYGGSMLAGPIYDAMLHSIFLGFVFSMIFGHAPVIIPAVLRVAVRYRPVFYVHLALLHGSLVARVAGDLLLDQPLRRWGGLFNVVAILLFLGVTLAPWSRSRTEHREADSRGELVPDSGQPQESGQAHPQAERKPPSTGTTAPFM
jgi:hypothetical protein